MGIIIELIGSIAGIGTTIAFLPQVIRTWKTKSTQDISLAMYLVFCSGVFLWLIYGIGIMRWPVILANTFTFILACSVLAMKLRYH